MGTQLTIDKLQSSPRNKLQISLNFKKFKSLYEIMFYLAWTCKLLIQFIKLDLVQTCFHFKVNSPIVNSEILPLPNVPNMSVPDQLSALILTKPNETNAWYPYKINRVPTCPKIPKISHVFAKLFIIVLKSMK